MNENVTVKSMKKLVRDLLILSVLLLVTGVACIVAPGSSGIVICYIIGAATGLFGVLRLVIYFASERTNPFGSFAFVQGIAFLIVGVFFLVSPAALEKMLTAIFAIILIIDGAMKLQYSIDLLRLKYSRWWLVFVFFAIAVLGGVLLLIKPFAENEGMILFSGICLTVDALLDGASLFVIKKAVPLASEDAAQPQITDGAEAVGEIPESAE